MRGGAGLGCGSGYGALESSESSLVSEVSSEDDDEDDELELELDTDTSSSSSPDGDDGCRVDALSLSLSLFVSLSSLLSVEVALVVLDSEEVENEDEWLEIEGERMDWTVYGGFRVGGRAGAREYGSALLVGREESFRGVLRARLEVGGGMDGLRLMWMGSLRSRVGARGRLRGGWGKKGRVDIVDAGRG